MTQQEFETKFYSCYEKHLKQFTDSKEIIKRLNLNDGDTLSTNENISKLFYLSLEISTKFLYETLSEVLDLENENPHQEL